MHLWEHKILLWKMVLANNFSMNDVYKWEIKSWLNIDYANSDDYYSNWNYIMIIIPKTKLGPDPISWYNVTVISETGLLTTWLDTIADWDDFKKLSPAFKWYIWGIWLWIAIWKFKTKEEAEKILKKYFPQWIIFKDSYPTYP